MTEHEELAAWLLKLAAERTCNRRRGIRPHPSALTRVAVLLKRQAAELERLRVVPVAVEERPWEREGWCDGKGRCWFWSSEDQCWFWERHDSDFCRHYGAEFECLPAHALPLPSGEAANG